jgi:hypothetical protein
MNLRPALFHNRGDRRFLLQQPSSSEEHANTRFPHYKETALYCKIIRFSPDMKSKVSFFFIPTLADYNPAHLPLIWTDGSSAMRGCGRRVSYVLGHGRQENATSGRGIGMISHG